MGPDATQVFPLRAATAAPRWQSLDGAGEVTGAWGSPRGALSPSCHHQGHPCFHPCRGRRASLRKSGQMSTVAWCLLSSVPPVLFCWSGALSLLVAATLAVPSLPPRGQSLTYYFMYLFKALQSPWPERHLVVMGPPG